MGGNTIAFAINDLSLNSYYVEENIMKSSENRTKVTSAKRRLYKQKVLGDLGANRGERIERLLEGIRNLPKEAVAHQVKSRDHTVPKDSLLNRCLSNIEAITYLIPKDEREGSSVLEAAWEVYMDLQNFRPAIGESQHWRPGTREFSLDSYDEDTLIIDDGVVMESSSPEVHSGGLGYRHVNWDSSYLMAQPVSGHRDGYYNPKEAGKRRPVKHYSREEIDKLLGAGG